MKQFIIRIIDKIIRVVLSRLAIVRAEHDKAVVVRANAALAAEGWRTLRSRPFVYSANAPRRGEFPRYFLITSQGLAGSVWLASSLTLHPEITCAMGIDHPFVSMRFYYNQDEVQRKLDGVTDVEQIQHGFYRDTLRKSFIQRFAAKGINIEGGLVRENPVRNLRKMYDELEMFFPAKYYGNVHACFAQQALEYLPEFPTRHDVTLMNLIRHPIPRTEAAITGILSVPTHYQDSDWHKGITEGIDEFTETHPDQRREIEKKFGVDFTNVRNRGILYSYYRALHNDCWAGEIMTVREACHVTMERLMADPDCYSWFLSEITGGTIAPTKDYLDQIYSETHLRSGRHTGRGRSITPREQFDRWSDWEKYEFRLVMHRLDLASVYAPFGYDFSFVK